MDQENNTVRFLRCNLIIVCTVFGVFLCMKSYAGSRLRLEADTIVYSGPSNHFRPIYSARAGETLLTSKKQVQGADGGEFYKVLIKRSKTPLRVGYISVDTPVKFELSEDEDDVDSYKTLSLAESAFQIGLQGLKDSTYVWTVGYLKYPTESLYLKFLIGQLLNQRLGSLMFGGEVGSDQLIYGQFSLYAAFSAGVFILPQNNLIFEGSRSLNHFAQGGTGIRFSSDENAALSLGMFQMVLLSPNNSFLSLGGSITLEVGL